MRLEGSRLIAAEAPKVWAAILNPETLQACIPACESMTGSVAAGYDAVVVLRLGPVSARFTGRITVSDMVEGKSLRIAGEGTGGVAGFARGDATIVLDPVPEGTQLSYAVEARVGGKLGGIGRRIIDGYAEGLTEGFFARFEAAVRSTPPEDVPAGDGSGDGKKSWLRRLIG